MYFIKFINRSFFDSLILPLTRICGGRICRIVAVMALLLVLCMPVSADVPPLLPMPQKVSMTDKWVTADGDVCFTKVDRVEGAESQDEAYRLVVDKHKVCIYATGDVGLFRGKQTLEQLTKVRNGKKFVPVCDITDWPAFRVRGFMHDIGRSFIPMDELKKEIELLSRFKINVFHWHLTENQAWRLESKLYPMLNAPENMERDKGRYYTLEEAHQLAEFCREHYVTLIPEIDMPGHSAAFERTFGFSMQTEEGKRIMKDLLAEACDALDVPYIHIGTDEVQFIDSTFVPEMVAFVRSKGKKAISWNPGWHYEKSEIDMTQLWSCRGKAQPGIPAIDCRFHYANHFDNYADLVALFNSRILDQPKGNDDIAGCILAFWNDRYIDNTRQLLDENNFYPYMLTLAERAWRGGGTCYFNGKGTLLWDDEPEQKAAFAEFENRMLWHKDHTLKREPFSYCRQTDAQWRITDAFPNEGDLTRFFPPEEHLSADGGPKADRTSYEYKGKTYGSGTVTGNGIYLRHVWGTLVPGFYTNPEENHTAYATRWVYSKKARTAKLSLEFYNYSRSESDLPPRQGTWDYKCSRAWINGEEIMPPVWENTNTERSNELPLRNENCVSRPPVEVKLQKGWNKIVLKLPVGKFTSKETRLVKWMFSATLTE